MYKRNCVSSNFAEKERERKKKKKRERERERERERDCSLTHTRQFSGVCTHFYFQ